jgi:type VI secretion system secreted protein Hcp
MAQADYFLKIEGVEGESQDDKHKSEIHISSFHLAASNEGTGQQNSGSGSGKVIMHDMQLNKLTDKSSPNLFVACATGKHFPTATLTVRKAGEHPHEYLIYKMTNVLISHYSSKSHGTGEIAAESIALNFSKIEMTYTLQNKDGTAGAKVVKTYDVAANKAS